MKLSDFDYLLPKELIAQYPLKKRDDCRLMVIDRARRSIEHSVFSSIGGYLNKGDLLAANDTRVLAARLIGRRVSGGRVEALLLEPGPQMTYRALLKPGRLKVGEKVIFDHGSLTAKVVAKDRIRLDAESSAEVLRAGCMPLPPYIKREAEELDNDYYQTVYAAKEGAIASPTAGLHFTRELMRDLESQGINFAYITLHVGLGTFKPVKAEDIREHKMEMEYFAVPPATEEAISIARSAKARVIVVGTTSLRALEAHAAGNKQGHTDLFIYPGYKFKTADCLLTNFHLPRTTLFMLVCAFGGRELMQEAYHKAVELKYRFYSYGTFSESPLYISAPRKVSRLEKENIVLCSR